MNKLDKFIEDNTPTKEEIDIYRKVKLLYVAEDLKNVLDDLLEECRISKGDYERIADMFEKVTEEYEDWLYVDWYTTMRDVILLYVR